MTKNNIRERMYFFTESSSSTLQLLKFDRGMLPPTDCITRERILTLEIASLCRGF